jgi:putative endonuclease
LVNFCRELGLGMPGKQVMTFTYVYILQSELNPRRFYTGCARDLRDRLNRHNSGKMVHTTKWKPWRIKTHIAISDRRFAARIFV